MEETLQVVPNTFDNKELIAVHNKQVTHGLTFKYVVYVLTTYNRIKLDT